ncbi:MAG: hypothetical protein RL240_3228 [Planctomycetota bacterium]
MRDNELAGENRLIALSSGVCIYLKSDREDLLLITA